MSSARVHIIFAGRRALSAMSNGIDDKFLIEVAVSAKAAANEASRGQPRWSSTGVLEDTVGE